VAGDHRTELRAPRGFVFGELLVALLLLIVAVSSLAALMYSVSHRPTTRAETECVPADAARGKCVPDKPAQTPLAQSAESKLLRSGCATRSVFDERQCKDTLVSEDADGDAVIKARTDSAAMGLLAKKQRAQAAAARTDRGFIR
jgi:uncharacterized low-complexity protein